MSTQGISAENAGSASVRVRERGLSRRIDRDLIAELDTLVADGPVCVRDPRVAGFQVRAWRPGLATYCVQLGRGKRKKIGRVGQIGLTDARDEAERLVYAEKHGPKGAPAPDAPEVITLGQLFDAYEGHAREALSRGEESLERLRFSFKDLLGRPLAELTPAVVKDWATRRKRKGGRGKRLSAATVRRDLAALGGALSFAVDRGWLAMHPLERLKLGSAFRIDRRGVVRFLSEAEESRLRKALTARDDHRRAARASANAWRDARAYERLPDLTGSYTDAVTPFVLALLLTGARFGEIASLTWQDVNLEARQITLPGPRTKSAQTRYVPINAELLELLKAWGPKPRGLVFPGKDGAPIVDLKSAWKSIVKASKLDSPFRIHDLRHTFASRLVQRGAPLQVVQRLLGHSSLRMTERYSHLNDQQLVDAVALLGVGGAK